jgi:hypothetical protein
MQYIIYLYAGITLITSLFTTTMYLNPVDKKNLRAVTSPGRMHKI